MNHSAPATVGTIHGPYLGKLLAAECVKLAAIVPDPKIGSGILATKEGKEKDMKDEASRGAMVLCMVGGTCLLH